mgnify:CR=1 FL=1
MKTKLATDAEGEHAAGIAASMLMERIRFVCVPTLDDEDHDRMTALSGSRLDVIIAGIDEDTLKSID